MKKINLTFFIILSFSILLTGCKSISLGGRGKVGTVRGSGTVSIPVPDVSK